MYLDTCIPTRCCPLRAGIASVHLPALPGTCKMISDYLMKKFPLYLCWDWGIISGHLVLKQVKGLSKCEKTKLLLDYAELKTFLMKTKIGCWFIAGWMMVYIKAIWASCWDSPPCECLHGILIVQPNSRRWLFEYVIFCFSFFQLFPPRNWT